MKTKIRNALISVSDKENLTLLLKILKKYNIKIAGTFPVSDHISKYGLYLPSGPNISIKNIYKVCDEINKFI